MGFVRDTAAGVSVGLTGAGDRERIADVELELNGNVVDARGLSQTGPQVLAFDAPEYEAGENRLELRINTDDDFGADNTWYHVVDRRPPGEVPLITLNPAGLPATYLSAALDSAGEFQILPLVPGEFDLRVLSRYRWAIVDDVGVLDEDLASTLLSFLSGGGSVLAFAGDRAAGLEELPLSGHRPAVAVLQSPTSLQNVGRIDLRHPALGGTDGWPSVNIMRNLPVDDLADDEVLIRLQNNEPFLIERRIDSGRLLLFTAGLDNRWNDLPVRPVFVSFMIEAGRYLSGSNAIDKTYVAGATLPLALSGASSGQVIDPDGNTVLTLADTTREQQIKLNKPGFYEVYTPQGETTVAANIDPRESDLTKVSQEVLDRWQGATAAVPASGAASFRDESPVTIELWHWFLLALAIVVIAESILGNMHLTARRVEAS